MTLRKITRMGHPLLLARARPVADPDDAEIQTLIDDMIDTMQAAEGIGLAAPQVHVGRRVIVALDVADRAEQEAARAQVMINPELEPIGDEIEHAFEGCLSIPDLRGLVPRHRRVAWRALDRRGRHIEGEAEGLFARVLQHEVDHLDGILYPMRMTDLRHLAFSDELRHLSAWIERGGDGDE